MKEGISKIHLVLAWAVVAAIVLQFFFAGLGVFHAGGFGPHIADGYLILLASLVLLILSLIGGLGMRRIGNSAALLALMIIQVLLLSGPPIVQALHPLNAILILGAAVHLAIRSRTKSTRPLVAS